jgi:hypothetical protein
LVGDTVVVSADAPAVRDHTTPAAKTKPAAVNRRHRSRAHRDRGRPRSLLGQHSRLLRRSH